MDEAAEIRAIAKKMLRKKNRLDILDNTYNRYAFDDDAQVPKWFKEEENHHNIPTLPATKEEIDREGYQELQSYQSFQSCQESKDSWKESHICR